MHAIQLSAIPDRLSLVVRVHDVTGVAVDATSGVSVRVVYNGKLVGESPVAVATSAITHVWSPWEIALGTPSPDDEMHLEVARERYERGGGDGDDGGDGSGESGRSDGGGAGALTAIELVGVVDVVDVGCQLLETTE